MVRKTICGEIEVVDQEQLSRKKRYVCSEVRKLVEFGLKIHALKKGIMRDDRFT